MTTNLSKPCELKNNEVSENTSTKTTSLKLINDAQIAKIQRLYTFESFVKAKKLLFNRHISDNIEELTYDEANILMYKHRGIAEQKVTTEQEATTEQKHIIQSNLSPDKYEACCLSCFGTFIPKSRLTKSEASLLTSQYIELLENTNVVEGEPKSKNTKITKFDPVKYTNLTINYSNSPELPTGSRVETNYHRNTKSISDQPIEDITISNQSMEDIDIRPHKNKRSPSEGSYKSIWDVPPPICKPSKITWDVPPSICKPSKISIDPSLKTPINFTKKSINKVLGKSFPWKKRVKEWLPDEITKERDEKEWLPDEITKERDEKENA